MSGPAADTGRHHPHRAAGAAWLLAPILLGTLVFALVDLRQPAGRIADDRLNHYILEHGFRALWDGSYPFPFWSPPMFAPFRNALALSDNLAGTAPLYWLLRAALPPEGSYLLWRLGVLALTALAMGAALRAMQVRPPVAAAGAYLFAYGLPRLVQQGHAQLFPALFAPLALLAALRFLEQPRVRWLAAACAAAVLQVLAGIYLGWFLLFGLAVLVAAAVAADPRDTGGRLLAFLRRRWPAALACAGLAAGALLLFLRPYLELQRGTGPWDFAGTVRQFLPVPASYLSTARPGRHLLPAPLPHNIEVALLPGFAAWAGLALLLVALARPAVWPTRGRRHAALACTLAFLVLTLLSMRWGGRSAWEAVYTLVPGAGAIRAVGRVWTVSYLLLFTALALWFDSWARREGAAPWRRALGWAGAALLVLEQVVLPSPVTARPPATRLHEEERQALARLLPGAAVALVGLPPYPRAGADANLDVMWAALEARVPVVNGSSGQTPPGYAIYTGPGSVDLRQTLRWMGDAVRGRFVVILPREVPVTDPLLLRGALREEAADGPWRVFAAELPVVDDWRRLRVTIGTAMDAGALEAGFEGWQEPFLPPQGKNWLRWSTGGQAVVRFRLDAPDGDAGALVLRFTARAAGDLAFAVSLNGRRLGDAPLRSRNREFAFAIPAGLARPGEVNEIAFEPAAPGPPIPRASGEGGARAGALRLQSWAIARAGR